MSNDLIERYYSENNAQKYNSERSGIKKTKRTNKWYFEDDVISQYIKKISNCSVVDAPVGTGRFFHTYHNCSSVLAVDYSQDMLREARKEKINTIVDFKHMDLINEQLNIQVNVLVCVRLLNLLTLPDVIKVLDNILPNISYGGMISVRDIEQTYTGEMILKNKIHLHDRRLIHRSITDNHFDIIKEHVYSDDGKPGRYCIYEIKRRSGVILQ